MTAVQKYSHEELVAEMTAAWLLSAVGLDPAEDLSTDSITYCQSWHKYLKDDPTALVSAAQHAQKAMDRILGVKPAPPSPRSKALDWIRQKCGLELTSAASMRGAHVIALTLSGRSSPLYLKTRTGKGSPDQGYRFKLEASEVKAWRASRGQRSMALLHGLLIIPLGVDGAFQPEVAPPFLLRLERLYNNGLRFNYFRGMGGRHATLGLVLRQPRNRKSWYLSAARANIELRLGSDERLNPASTRR